MVAGNETTSLRDEALWATEVEHLVHRAGFLRESACAAVEAVLRSLADDPTESRATQADALMLLALLGSLPRRSRLAKLTAPFRSPPATKAALATP